MSSYDVTINDVIRNSWIQFTNLETFLPVFKDNHQDKLSAADRLSITQNLAEILFFKVWNDFAKETWSSLTQFTIRYNSSVLWS